MINDLISYVTFLHRKVRKLVQIPHDTIRDAVLTCAQKLT